MHKFNYLLSFILAVTLPLTILILSSNLILRTSEVYVYHFNDSQVVSDLPYSVEERTIATAVSSYWSHLGSKSFQVYEDNGQYKDPVFEEKEQVVMYKTRRLINLHLLAGLLLMIISAVIYIYLLKRDFRAALRNRYRFSVGFAAVLMIVRIILFSTKSFRIWAYNCFIGIDLDKESNLMLLLGDPFFKTFLLFTTIAGAAFLGIMTYVNIILTKPERLFY